MFTVESAENDSKELFALPLRRVSRQALVWIAMSVLVSCGGDTTNRINDSINPTPTPVPESSSNPDPVASTTPVPSPEPSSNPTPAPTPPPVSFPGDANEGEKLYIEQCLSCHGDNGVGGLGGPLDQSCESCSSFETLSTIIRDTMPVFDPKTCDVDCANDVSVYIMNGFKGAPAPSPMPPATTPSPQPTSAPPVPDPTPTPDPIQTPTPSAPMPSPIASPEPPVPTPEPSPQQTPSLVPQSLPFHGMPFLLPDRIEAEDYDFDGFNDSTAGNRLNSYRDDDVDVGSNRTDGFAVRWVDQGEWLEYTIESIGEQEYKLSALTASPRGGGQISVYAGGHVLMTSPALPNTGSWLKYEWRELGTLTLSDGEQVLRIYVENAGFDIDALNFDLVDGGSTPAPTATPTATATVTPTPMPTPATNPGDIAAGENLYALQCVSCHGVQGEGGIGGALDQSCDSCGSFDTLSRLIRDTMPADDSTKCGETCANDISAFILNGFGDGPAPAPTPTPRGKYDIQAIMARSDVNCTNSSCHDTTPGSARVNLLSGSLEDLAQRLVDKPSGNSNCDGELLIDSAAPQNSLLYKLIDDSSGDQCLSKMPFGRDGIPDQFLPAFEKWIDDIIDASNAIDPVEPPSVGEVVPNTPLSVASKLKYVLHGGALTNAEFDRVSFNPDQLDPEGLKGVVSDWMKTNKYDRKLSNFLELALQQRTANGSYSSQLAPLTSRGAQFRTGLDQMFVRTAKRIINDDEDFRQIGTTNKWEMTTANLAAMVYADMGFNFQGHYFRYYRLAFLTNEEDRNDWRTVTLRASRNGPEFPDRPSSFDMETDAFVQRMRNIKDGGTLDLYGERVGFFTAPVFFDNWRTNDANGHRVTTNQALIVGLGKTFESGDLTKPTQLDRLKDEIGDHAKEGSDCFGCHKNLDVMRNVFRNHYGTTTHRPTHQDNLTEFAFQGAISNINSMADFGRAIVNHPRFPVAWVQKLCQWVNSKECSDTDPEVQRLAQFFVSSGYSFNSLLLEFVSSPLVTHTDTSVENSVHSGSMVSIARSNHYCEALTTRIEMIRDARNMHAVSRKHIDLCKSEGVSGNIPSDSIARGVVPIVQAVEEDALLAKTYDTFCKKITPLVVGTRPEQTFQTRNSSAAMDDMVSTIMGYPSNTEEYSHARSTLQRLYDIARKTPSCGSTSALAASASGDISCGLGQNPQQALSLVWSSVCQSPSFTGMGL